MVAVLCDILSRKIVVEIVGHPIEQNAVPGGWGKVQRQWDPLGVETVVAKNIIVICS